MTPRSRSRRHFLQAAALAAWGPCFEPAGAATAEGPLLRRLRFNLAATNPTGEALINQRAWLYLPMARAACQLLLGLRVSMPWQREDDELGHCIVHLQFDRIAPFDTRLVSLTTDLEIRSEPVPESLADPAAWLGAERNIEMDDADIRALAAELRRATPADTGRAIFEWVRDNLAYAGYLPGELGAREALHRRRGDCTEYAALAVALARANGIPARRVAGHVCDRDMAPRPEDYHDWAELHLAGKWRLLDAQKGHWLVPADQYVAFHVQRDTLANPIGPSRRHRVEGGLGLRFQP